MLAYLVLAGHDGAPVDPALIRRFAGDPPTLPFIPTERLLWTNQAGNVVFLGWQAFTDFAGLGSHWSSDDLGLTAFGGICFPRETGWNVHSGQSWAAQLRNYLGNAADPRDVIEALFGQFTILSLPSHGTATIATDFAGIDPLYVATSNSVTAVSNRAGFCAMAVTQEGVEPARSPAGAGWIIAHGEIFDTETGYWDVERLPLGASISIDPRRGASIVPAARSPLGPVDPDMTYQDLVAAVEAELRGTIRTIAALPVSDMQVELSGGRDSRLMTAAMLAEGVADRFHFVTIGPPERPDSVAASQIARRYGLAWTPIDRSSRSSTEEASEVLAHTSLVEGMTSSWNAVGSTRFTGGVTVNGVAGEYLRWGRCARAGAKVSTESELFAVLRKYAEFDPMGVLKPEVLEYYHQALAGWAREQLELGEDLDRIGSYFNMGFQVRNRFGPQRAWNSRIWLSPFLTPAIVRANQHLARGERPSPRFQVDLLRHFDIELSKLPYAFKPWPDGALDHLPDAEEYRRISPLQLISDDGRQWRQVRYADYRPMLEHYLLDEGNPVDDLVDSDRLRNRIATGDAHPGRTRRLWGVLTAAIWMGQHELAAKIERA